MPTVSAIVPVFNAANTLRALHGELVAALARNAEEFEIILVEDGGRDNSWPIITELAEQDHRVSGIRLSRNFGQHNALLCGIRAARYDVIVTLDDDLQNPPDEMTHLLARLEEGFDVVYGAPDVMQHGLFRNLASRITKLALQNFMGADAARNSSAFRAFRTRLREAFKDYSGPFVSIDVLLTWGTTKFSSVTVRNEPRAVGESNYTLGKLIRHAVNLMTGFSTLPLQIASLLGFAFTIFGMGVLAWVVGRYLVLGTSIPGFPFLASIIAIFSGAQLFALGVFGEYLARIHFRTMGRPPFVISEASDHE
jgi:undecaprenyl-phosphate 4-deoxy-4-formamido-L-arabinose transferase